MAWGGEPRGLRHSRNTAGSFSVKIPQECDPIPVAGKTAGSETKFGEAPNQTAIAHREGNAWAAKEIARVDGQVAKTRATID